MRDAHRFRGFFNGEPAKETQFNSVAVLWIERRQSLQRIVERYQIEIRFAADAIRRADGKPQRLSSPFRGAAFSRVVDKDVAHHLCRHAKELRAVAEARGLLVYKSQVDFIYERSGLKRVIGSLASQVFLRKAAQFAVDQRHQLIERRLIAMGPSSEQLSYVLVWLHTPAPHLASSQFHRSDKSRNRFENCAFDVTAFSISLGGRVLNRELGPKFAGAVFQRGNAQVQIAGHQAAAIHIREHLGAGDFPETSIGDDHHDRAVLAFGGAVDIREQNVLRFQVRIASFGAAIRSEKASRATNRSDASTAPVSSIGSCRQSNLIGLGGQSLSAAPRDSHTGARANPPSNTRTRRSVCCAGHPEDQSHASFQER